MKKSFIICAAFCFVSSFPLLSQNKTLFHYPLNDGDLWEYWEGPRFFIYEQRKIIGDTLLPNGNFYKIIEVVNNQQHRGLMFQRVEKKCVYQYAPRFVPPNTLLHEEILLYKLEIELGDIWPYPGYEYDGFLADPGFVQVNEFGSLNFGGQSWEGVALGSYTLPDTGLWFDPDVILLDSLGVYIDAYEGGYLQLRGAIINRRQFGTITSVNDRGAVSSPLIPVVASFRIFPNPIVSDAQVQFELTDVSEIRFSIFDILGRELYELPMRRFDVGRHSFTWGGARELAKPSLPNGIYFIVFTDGLSQPLVRKFTVTK